MKYWSKMLKKNRFLDSESINFVSLTASANLPFLYKSKEMQRKDSYWHDEILIQRFSFKIK